MFEQATPSRRLAWIASLVVSLHAVALWGVQSGMARRVMHAAVPVSVLQVSLFPEAPQALPVHPAQKIAKPVRPFQPALAPALAAPRLPAQPLTPQAMSKVALDTADAPLAVTSALTPQTVVPMAGAAAGAGTAPAAPSAPKLDLPTSDADYLNNPKPSYPLLSKRAGEQGRVLVRVLIGADGLAQKAELKTSSGFERLDRAAVTTVLKWRYVPGKRAGVAQAMWFTVPIDFVLE